MQLIQSNFEKYSQLLAERPEKKRRSKDKSHKKKSKHRKRKHSDEVSSGSSSGSGESDDDDGFVRPTKQPAAPKPAVSSMS